MRLLDEYFALQKQIYQYFGYVEDWAVIPIDDERESYWQLLGNSVRFAETKEQLLDDDAEEYYENEIYTQRHLPKWVYRGEEYTMICVDTHIDANKFLQIFDNSKEIKK